jgi:hypothetical protein
MWSPGPGRWHGGIGRTHIRRIIGVVGDIAAAGRAGRRFYETPARGEAGHHCVGRTPGGHGRCAGVPVRGYCSTKRPHLLTLLELSEPPVISSGTAPVTVTTILCVPLGGFTRLHTSRNPLGLLLLWTVVSNVMDTSSYVTRARWRELPCWPRSRRPATLVWCRRQPSPSPERSSW